ncbi:hypothetical protein [Nesterenkonia sp. CF4.4]|uniref:hypothetical protein n=1 Tax=Nesterenkonia sp. CF4.4 TaxID=3373079 RepID=UPI003EE7B5B0
MAVSAHEMGFVGATGEPCVYHVNPGSPAGTTCVDEVISISDKSCAAVLREEIDWRGLRDIAAETGGPTTDFIPAFTRTWTNDHRVHVSV